LFISLVGIICKHIRILCIKLEINQGYTTMHCQPAIKISWADFKSHIPSFVKISSVTTEFF
jgi:hypothetical protein